MKHRLLIVVLLLAVCALTLPSLAQAGPLRDLRTTSRLHAAYVANDDTNQLLVTSSSDGVIWSPDAIVDAHSSKFAPAVVVFNNKLHVVYVANNDTNQMLAISSPDAVNWSADAWVDAHTSKEAPALAYYSRAARHTFLPLGFRQ